MHYHIYLDESGNFSKDEMFSLIGGCIWPCKDDEDINSTLRAAVTDLFSGWRAAGFVQDLKSIHSTENRYFKTHALQTADHRGLARQLTSIQLLTNCQPLMIYAHKTEIDQGDYLHHRLYMDMLDTLILETTAYLREQDAEAQIFFHIPTKQATVAETDEEERRFYRSLGITENRSKKPEERNFSINEGTRFLAASRANNFEFEVKIINYSKSDPDQVPPEMWGYYLADWLCSMLNGQIRGVLSKNQYRHAEVLNAAAGSIVFPYASLCKSYTGSSAGDIPAWLETYTALSTRTNLAHYKEAMERRNPFITETAIQTALGYITETYYFQTQYEKAQKMYEILRDLIPQELTALLVMDDLDSQCLACLNHQGRTEEASILFETIMTNTRGNPSGHFRWRLVLLYMETHIDLFNYDYVAYSLQESLESLKTLPQMPEILRSLGASTEIPKQMQILCGKYYSQLGQVYGYQLKFEKACAAFRKALTTFADLECSWDTSITQSHYLHLLADNDRFDDEFASLAESYWRDGRDGIPADNLLDANTWSTWADTILANPETVDRFSLFVFLKSLYRFCQASGAVADFTATITHVLDKTDTYTRRSTHPIQLVYKYRCLLAGLTGNEDRRHRYYNALRNSFENSEGLIRLIWICAKAACLHARGSEGELANLKRDALAIVDAMLYSVRGNTIDGLTEVLEQKRSQIEAITCMADFYPVVTYSYR